MDNEEILDIPHNPLPNVDFDAGKSIPSDKAIKPRKDIRVSNEKFKEVIFR